MAMKEYLAVVFFAFTATTSEADMFTPSHSCSKPYKPFQFNSQWEVDSFYEEVEAYKRCISNFVDEQNEEAVNHQEAASDAIDEWNNFVNYELN